MNSMKAAYVHVLFVSMTFVIKETLSIVLLPFCLSFKILLFAHQWQIHSFNTIAYTL